MADDVTVLREVLQRELETINAYEAMLPRLTDPKLRQIVEHITDEEREHVAEMYELIMEHDPRQRARTEKGEEHLVQMLGTQPQGRSEVQPQSAAEVAGTAPLTGEDPAQEDLVPPPPPVFPSAAWSVGSLKRPKP